MLTRRQVLSTGAGFILALGSRPAAAGGAAGDVVRGFYDALLGAMKEADALGYEGRFNKMSPAIETAFDMPYMTRVAVGRTWTSLSDEVKDRLIDVFLQFTVANYASSFDGYSGERFEVGAEKALDDGRLIAFSKMIRTQDPPIEFNYIMRQEGDSWRILDILLDGTISQLAARRSEFTSIIGREGVEGLITTLEKKIMVLERA